MRMIAVISVSRHLFGEFLMHMDREDRHKFIRVYNEETLRGFEFLQVITLGDKTMIENYDEILEQIKARVR